MANTVKAWILANPELDTYYETCDVVYEGRYSIQKLLTNNELKYAVTEEYTFRESEEIKNRQYYTLGNTTSDMEQRYLLCTGYVYRFRSRADTNNQYSLEVLLYIADSGTPLGIVEIIPSEGSVSDNIPSVPPAPYDDYTLNVTGVEQSTVISFIIDNPILSTIPDINDGSVFMLDENYYFDSISARDEYFRKHPVELATRSPLLAAVRDSNILNKYNIWRYYHNTQNWENMMPALAGEPGPSGRHAVMVVPEDAVTTGAPGTDAVVRCVLVTGASDSDSGTEEQDNNIYKLFFTIPRGDTGAQGIPGNSPKVGEVLAQTLEYSNTAQAFINESFDDDTDPGHLQPYLNFRFGIPRGFPGISPKISPSNGHWLTYTDVLSASDEYEQVDTGIMARGDPGLCPRVNTTTWHWEIATPAVVGTTTTWTWTDTGIRAYGTNLLFTSGTIYPDDSRTIPVSELYLKGYTTEEITLNSVVMSLAPETHNNYGRITALSYDSGNVLTGVTVKYESTIDSRTTVNSFVPGSYYAQGELCLHDGATYRARASFTAGSEFQSADWDPIVGETVIINDYLPGAVYRYHEVVKHGADFYRCASTGFPGFGGTLLFGFSTQGPVEWWRKIDTPAFAEGDYYASGDIAAYSGSFYRCLSSHVAAAGEDPALHPELWTEITESWASGTAYIPGQYVLYDEDSDSINELYLCANANQQTVFTDNNLYWYQLGIPVNYDESLGDEVSAGTYVIYDNNGSLEIGIMSDDDTVEPVINPDQSAVSATDLWQANTQYDAGYYVLHNDVLFRCCKQNTLASFRMDDPSIPYTIWENMRGSGSSSYTAGSGISISASDVISVSSAAPVTANGSGQLTIATDSSLAVNGSGELGVVIDSALSANSANPVQNQVIYQAIGDLETLLNRI